MKTFVATCVLTTGASLFWFALGHATLAQDSGLATMHILAPEFPSASSEAGPGGNLPEGGPAVGPTLPNSPVSAGGAAPGSQPSGIQSPTAPAPFPPGAAGGVTWINSPPLSMRGLRGKVVMIDFWDYTCINCIRTFPENKKLWDRYRNDGFTLIGVDDAEFSSAAPVERVREAVKRFELPYPVVVDHNYQIWQAYHNSFWPNIFLIDAQGYVRYNHEGEGADVEIERAIQGLLKEAHPDITFPESGAIAADVNISLPACGGAPTPEMYVGDWQGHGVVANPEGYHDGKTLNYAAQNSVEDGHVTLAGRWQTEKSGMVDRAKHSGDEPGQDHATLRYHARELYSVMSLAKGHEARLFVMQDGKYLTAANQGADVTIDSQGRSSIVVREPRLYYLVQNAQFGSHTVDLLPAADGLTINSFTFGNNCQTDFAHR